MDASMRSEVSMSVLAFVVCAGLSACSAANNPVLGRVEADVAGHRVIVANCYTMHVPDVRSSDGGQSFAPCKNASVAIKNDMVFVNGESYGQVAQGDIVMVENGRAKIVPR